LGDQLRLASPSLRSARNKGNGLALLLLFVISLAANSPLLDGYQFFLDDYLQFNKTFAEWIEMRGVWRIVGTIVPGSLVTVNVYGLNVYGLAAISIHALGGFLFYLVARRCLGSVFHALFLTVVMLAFPWGYQALIWASASSYAFANCLLWAILYVLLVFRVHQVWSYFLAAGVVCASFLCLLLHEAVFFPLCLAGMIVWIRPTIFRDNWRLAVAVSLAPLIGASLWVAVYELLKPASPVFSITNINFPTVFSAIFYQYSNLEVFDVWTHKPLRDYVMSTIGMTELALTLIAFSAIPFLVGAVLRAGRDAGKGESRSSRNAVTPGAFLICMLILSVGAGSIYALAGGYSLDSRKRYIIVPLALMTAAAAAWVIWGPQQARASWPRGRSIATNAICIFGCVTSLFMMSLWKQEVARLNLLADLIAENGLSGEWYIDWNPDLNLVWPRAERSFGMRADTGLNAALHARGYGLIISSKPESAHRIFWNSPERRWGFQGSAVEAFCQAGKDGHRRTIGMHC
jgi:hypothetical protein